MTCIDLTQAFRTTFLRTLEKCKKHLTSPHVYDDDDDDDEEHDEDDDGDDNNGNNNNNNNNDNDNDNNNSSLCTSLTLLKISQCLICNWTMHLGTFTISQ